MVAVVLVAGRVVVAVHQVDFRDQKVIIELFCERWYEKDGEKKCKSNKNSKIVDYRLPDTLSEDL